jgi:hypothetical protein
VPSIETLAETAFTTPPNRLNECTDEVALAERTDAHEAPRSAEPADMTELSSGNARLDAVTDRSGGGTTAGPTTTLGRWGNSITAAPLAAQPDEATGAGASVAAAALADSVEVTAGAVVVTGVLAVVVVVVVVDVVSEGGVVTVVLAGGGAGGGAGAVVAVVCGAGGGASSDTAASGKASATNATAIPSPATNPQRDLGIGHRYHAPGGTAARTRGGLPARASIVCGLRSHQSHPHPHLVRRVSIAVLLLMAVYTVYRANAAAGIVLALAVMVAAWGGLHGRAPHR